MPKIITITALFFLSASAAWGQQREGGAAFDRDHPLSFGHRCSELGHSGDAYWQAYAFFEKPSPDDRYEALALANVLVGWIAGPHGPNGVALAIEKKRFALPPEWHGDTFGLALQLVNVKTQQAITGTVSTSYLHSTNGHYPVDRAYRLSATGELDWVQFVEPEESEAKATKEYNHSPDLHVYSEDIPALEGTHTLKLVLENTRTSSRLTLEGPVLKNLRSLLQIEKPKMRVLGLFQTMNPFQKGGLWDWIKTGLRYDECIHRRKRAKKEFDLRFTRTPFSPPSPR